MRAHPAFIKFGLALLAACVGAACASLPAPIPTASAIPPATAATEPVAPTGSATATGEPRAVEFPAPDGATLHGTLYGAGDTVIIFSEMGAQKQATWAAAAQAFVHTQGARRVVLVGASLGALATIKVAAAAGVTAVVILAAPLGPVSGLNLQVTPAEVQVISAPKLFIASEGDEAGFADDVQQMYNLAAGPKDLQFYPGRAHGTDLLTTASGPAVIERILAFIETYAPLGPRRSGHYPGPCQAVQGYVRE